MKGPEAFANMTGDVIDNFRIPTTAVNRKFPYNASQYKFCKKKSKWRNHLS